MLLELDTNLLTRFGLTALPVVILMLLVPFAKPTLFRFPHQMSLALLVGGVPLGVLFSRSWFEVPTITKSAIRSDQIWSITLQNPSQVVRRVVPRPKIGSATAVRIRVSLESDYHGPSFLTATVHGDDFGRMFPAGAQRGLSVGHDSLVLIFDSSALDGFRLIFGRLSPIRHSGWWWSVKREEQNWARTQHSLVMGSGGFEVCRFPGPG